jgi:hypothetical protein
MGDMLATDRCRLSIAVKIMLVAKLDKVAAATGITRNELINIYLEREAKDVKLTSEEVDAVLAKIKENEDKRNGRKRNGRRHH